MPLGLPVPAERAHPRHRNAGRKDQGEDEVDGRELEDLGQQAQPRLCPRPL